MIVAVSTRCAPMLYFKAFLCSVFSVAPWRMGLGIGSRGCPETGIHHRGTEITENKPLILRLLDLCVSVVRID
jgi:hypothetical protein